jgi:carbonic anhydrase
LGNAAATIVRTAGGRVHSALNTLLVLSAVGNEGKKGLIIVVHHTGMFLFQELDVIGWELWGDEGREEEGRGKLEESG